VWAAWRYRQRYPLACYGFFAFLLLISPTSSFVPILDPLVERRLYLPLIGLLLILFDLLRRLPLGRPKLAVTLLAVLSASAALSYHRNLLWSNPIALWGDAVSKSPGKPRTHFHLGVSLQAGGRCRDAEQQYIEAARLLPLDPKHPTELGFEILGNWGLACACLKRPDQALDKLLQAAQIQPSAHLYSQIGMIYQGLGAWSSSLHYLQRALEMDGGYEPTYVYLGNLYLETKHPEDAANYFQQALRLDPSDRYAREALQASVYQVKNLGTIE
jgi:tetratricopeptide (TPR) repeat protein